MTKVQLVKLRGRKLQTEMGWSDNGGKTMGLKENQELAEYYPILQFFYYNHLPEHLQKVSIPFNTLAWKLVKTLPRNAETSVFLRKLLEAKDAAVRSATTI